MTTEQQTPKETMKKDDRNIPSYNVFQFSDKFDGLLMMVGTISAITNGLSHINMVLLVGDLINSLQGNTVNEVSKVALELVDLAFITGFASLLQRTCWIVAGERQAARIQSLYLKTLLRQDITFIDNLSLTGEVVRRMSANTELIQDALGDKMGNHLQHSTIFVGSFIIASNRGWKLTLVLLACIAPAMVIVLVIHTMDTNLKLRHGQVGYSQAGKVVEETLGEIRTVVSFGGERLVRRKYNRMLEFSHAWLVRKGLIGGIYFGIVSLILFISYGVAIWYGSKLILEDGIGYNPVTVINVTFSMMTSVMSMIYVYRYADAFPLGQVAANKMLDIINRNPLIDSSDTNGIVLKDIKGEIELKDVHFKYPGKPNVQIFSGLSLHIPSGKSIALVGQSGSGKSTVISLVQRFYDPDSGQVYIDGIDLKKFQLKWIRQQIGLVSQEPILFATSIRENISYGKENATNSEIRNAIESAKAAKFIDKLPMGLDTIIGERGTYLSGGEKQRIAIARAIINNPKILLLDEATSDLDAKSERIVQEALESVMLNRTTIVIAHQLATIQNTDLIAVIHVGKLVEQGTHSELIRNPNSVYSQLTRIQTENSKGVKLEKVDIPLNKSTRNGVLEKDKEVIQKSNMGRLIKLNEPEYLIHRLLSISSFISGCILSISGFLLSSSLKNIFQPPSQKLIKDSEFWALMYFFLGISSLLVVVVYHHCYNISYYRLIQRIRSLAFKKVVHQEMRWFDDPSNLSGVVGDILSSDASNVRSSGELCWLYFYSLGIIISSILIASTSNYLFTLIVLLVLIIMFIQTRQQINSYKMSGNTSISMYEEASQVAKDVVGNIRTVSSLCAEEKVMQIYNKKREGLMKHGLRFAINRGVSLGFTYFTHYVTTALLFYLGALLIQYESATFGQVLKVYYSLYVPVMTLLRVMEEARTSGTTSDVNRKKTSEISIFKILDRNSKIDSSSKNGTTLDVVMGDIEFKNVSFKYITRPNVQILKNLCLNIPSGKTIALVGESGSGKSTIISLIERFYDPDSGSIYIDGVDIRTLKLSWLRKQIGLLVSQEPILLDGTIRDNIVYSNQGGVSEEEIIVATKAANAHNFISGLPQGYKTNVGEKGVQLSIGQKQRIAIARVILKNPRILLLDEATSGLDSESERLVQDALDKVMVNRTTVVVAHRLTKIRGADMIVVVKNGTISEKGTHDVLMNKKDGVYASLVALQTTST